MSPLATRNRHVPEQMWYTHPAFAITLGGILPFGAVCIELFFIMSALWLHQVRFSQQHHMRKGQRAHVKSLTTGVFTAAHGSFNISLDQMTGRSAK